MYHKNGMLGCTAIVNVRGFTEGTDVALMTIDAVGRQRSNAPYNMILLALHVTASTCCNVACGNPGLLPSAAMLRIFKPRAPPLCLHYEARRLSELSKPYCLLCEAVCLAVLIATRSALQSPRARAAITRHGRARLVLGHESEPCACRLVLFERQSGFSRTR